MDFMAKRREQSNINSIADLIKSGKISGKVDPKKMIKGPKIMDCLVRPWCKGDLTLLLAGAGVGKTSTVLYMFKHILLNNSSNNDAVVFISLEMTASEIAEKWLKLTKDNPELSERLFIIENYDEYGVTKALTVDGIKHELKMIKHTTNCNILAFALDHIHQINNNGSSDFNPIMDELKATSVEIDAHGFILSQTTKGKGVGDIPVPKDGCFGTSKAEWLATNIITIFQPLMRVQKEANLPVLAWQYAKIRYKNKEDKIREGMNYLLYFEHDTQDLRLLTRNEKTEFTMWYERVLELRQNEEKFKSYQFDISEQVTGKDGKIITLTKVIGGNKTPEDTDEL